EMTDKSNPEHGAKWPRRPDLFLRRVIRGMLPKRAVRMKDALSRLRVYLGVPAGVSDAQSFLPEKMPNRVVSVGKVCQRLGWNGTLPIAKQGS
ncbi:MAG TPA: uL13 family ribosomal protein, partial [Candidatus Norongarragalinales archaeon]|nr:uL13 family ribosomal protein [Candidatus Norongarragalinales archaeon]